MKGWRQDLLDHLVWLTFLASDRRQRLEDVEAELKSEIPCLRLARSATEFEAIDSRD